MSAKSTSIVILSLLASLAVAGCAAETSTSEEEATSAAEALKSRDPNAPPGAQHWQPAAPSAAWHPGCGVQRPDGTACPVGLFVTFTKQYFDLTSHIAVDVNNHTHKIKIAIDVWSTNQFHSMIAVRPQEVAITDDMYASSERVEISKTYDVKIVDYQGHTVWTGAVSTFLAY